MLKLIDDSDETSYRPGLEDEVRKLKEENTRLMSENFKLREENLNLK